MFPLFHEWIWNDCVDNVQIAQIKMSKKCHLEVCNATEFEQGENRMEMVMGSFHLRRWQFFFVFDTPTPYVILKSKSY